MKAVFKVYYHLRGFIPRSIQMQMRQCLARRQLSKCGDIWPIDPEVAMKRPPWDRWHENKRFALVLTHDVETTMGVNNCESLMRMEKELGFRSSFNFVPERYNTPPQVRQMLEAEGFEIGVHGLLHDGKLYNSKKIFMERAEKINAYLEAWNAVGFRSPAMHHDLEWLHVLNVQYDLSTFDSDPFEPDNTGFNTIFPQWIQPFENYGGYMELPYTLPQDSTLFLLLQNHDIDIWKKKLDWIVEQGGMALINTHPDYMAFSSDKYSNLTYPAGYYQEFLQYILTKYEGKYWHALPREMASFARPYFRESDKKSFNGIEHAHDNKQLLTC